MRGFSAVFVVIRKSQLRLINDIWGEDFRIKRIRLTELIGDAGYCQRWKLIGKLKKKKIVAWADLCQLKP